MFFSAPSRPEDAPDKATMIEIGFEKGDAVSLNGKQLSPAEMLTRLNDLAMTTASAGSIWWRTALSA